MTPERLATLCGLLPELHLSKCLHYETWHRSVIHLGATELGNQDDQTGKWHLPQKDADHLLMEALRAVENREQVREVCIRSIKRPDKNKVSEYKAEILLRSKTLIEKRGGEPLYAILDAVKGAGL